jgi:hypothetical protein
MVRVDVWHDEKNDVDRFTVTQEQHPSNGAGIRETLAEGIIGKTTRKPQPRPGLIGELTETLRAALEYCDPDGSARGRYLRATIENAIKKAEG